MKSGRLAFGFVFALALTPAHAADWPHWLGPNQNGSVAAGGVLSGSPRLRKAWRRPIGGGRSGLAVADGRLYALVSDGEIQSALALQASDGKELWSVALGPHVDDSLAPVSTPAVDAGRVFVVGTDCRLRALDAATGAAAWQIDLKQRFGATLRRGCESSPFVENGRLILQPGGAEDHRLVALDARSGELVWSAKGIARANYSSPVAAEILGVRQVVVHHVTSEAPQRSGISGFRLADGALLWSRTFEANVSTETPLALPDDRVLLVTWNDAKLARVRRVEDRYEAEPAWTTTSLRSRISPPVHRDGHLFGFDGDDLVCLRVATGEVAWRQRLYAGSLILVDDALVVLSATAGVVRIVEATPAGYRARGELSVLQRGAQAETPPSFSGRTIFVRNDEEIAAVVVDP